MYAITSFWINARFCSKISLPTILSLVVVANSLLRISFSPRFPAYLIPVVVGSNCVVVAVDGYL